MKLAVLLVLELLVIGRVLLRPHREPASRVAWIAVIALLPGLGALAYLFLGETSIGRRRLKRLVRIKLALPSRGEGLADYLGDLTPPYAHLTRVVKSISGFEAVGCNTGLLLRDSRATFDALVADIDAAREHVHVVFYIWLPDDGGRRVADALIRAAGRGIACRALVDGVGSQGFIESDVWGELETAGVGLRIALRVGNPLLRPFAGRIDLRNHRKIVVIDDRITYCGSQNCADPEFRIKAKYAPWVDAMVRFEGPIARQNQILFATDWMQAGGDDVGPLLDAPLPAFDEGFVAQVIGTGPTTRNSALSEMFGAILYAARRSVTITTPYYVPDDPLQLALCNAGYRGVDTTVVFPARNDSWFVGAASRSYYSELLTAGVKIFEYVGGLLHAKTLTLDEDVALIGSANMDRRSFELNYENNILFQDAELAGALRERQRAYIARSKPVTLDEVNAWPRYRVLWNNAIGMVGPVL